MDNKTILIIDDEATLADLMKFHLTAKGHRAITAGNGEEGLLKLKTITPDLIVLDINMPKMNGIEFYKAILTQHGHPKYPVFVLTSRAELKETFSDINAAGFLPKPFLMDDFMCTVEGILSRPFRPLVCIIDFSQNVHSKKIAESLKEEQYDVVCFNSEKEVEGFSSRQKPLVIFVELSSQDLFDAAIVSKIKAYDIFCGTPLIGYLPGGSPVKAEEYIRVGINRFLDSLLGEDAFVRLVKEIELKLKK